MMSINVYAVPENTRKKIHNSPYNVQDRVDLILILDELILNNVLPLNQDAILEVSFIFSPDNGVPPRQVLKQAYKVTDLIQDSFSLEYQNGNPLKITVEEKWIENTADEAIRARQDEVVPSLFGRDVHQKFLLEVNDKQTDI